MTHRVLLAQIYEPGDPAHATALRYKRGLYNALAAQGPVHDFDYLANDRDTLYDGFANRIHQFEPTIILSQFHAADLLTPDQIRSLKALRPGIIWANWSGDSWAHSLTAPNILEMARAFDVQLVAAPDAIPIYEAAGIPARYWNIAYEEPVEDLPDVPAYDVVFLGNVINEKRRAMMERLRAMKGVRVGIYGDWSEADGQNTYNFPAGEALYKNAKLAICDNVYQDQQNYISNRPMQAMAAGGAMVLHQHVPKMQDLSYWLAGVHYIEWKDLDELEQQIRTWLRPELAEDRHRIVAAGERHTRYFHSWTRRVEQLFELIPKVAAGIPQLQGERA